MDPEILNTVLPKRSKILEQTYICTDDVDTRHDTRPTPPDLSHRALHPFFGPIKSHNLRK
jgi:hypothetical protein